MSQQKQHVYEFGPFRLDAGERVLLRDGKPVPLTPKAFETLLVLVARSGRVVEKDEMMREVWPDTFVEEGGLNVNIFRLRKALGDDAEAHRYIETVPRRGYRFVAEVRELGVESPVPKPGVGADAPDAGGAVKSPDHPGAPAGTQTPEPAATVASAPFVVTSRRRKLIFAAFALLVVGLGAAIYFRGWRSSARPETVPEVRSIAVLPLKTLGSAGGEDEHLGQGMADALITKLSNVKQVAVRPTRDVALYAGAEADAAGAGRALKVDAVLDGRIQREGHRVRVTVQLVRAADGVPLWASTFDDQFTNIFAVQDSISEQVVRALTLELSGEERKLIRKHYTENAEAYELYLKGRFFWNKRTEEGYHKAVGYFRQAISRDPGYALAYSGLADSYHLLGDYSYLSPREAFPNAKEAAAKALELDDTLAEAHTSLAYAKFLYDWKWAEAEAEFKKAIALNPGYATARQWYCEYLVAMGRSDEAAAEIDRALRLEPNSLALNSVAGWVAYVARDYRRAIEQSRKALDMEPNFYPARFWLGQAYEKQGDAAAAIAEYERAVALSEGSPEILASLGHAHAVAGRREKAREVLARLEELSRRRYVSPYFAALIHAGLGEKDQAFDRLEEGFRERARAMPFLKVDPMMDELRADPRFTDLLRRVGLADAP